MNNYTICITMHDKVALQAASLHYKLLTKNLNVVLVNGTDIESYSKLANTCITTATTEYVIIASHKLADVDLSDVEFALSLIDKGFAMVGLCSLRFMAFHKDVFRRIGFWDERFIGSQAEDGDFERRLKFANMAMYETYMLEYYDRPSTWSGKPNATTVFYQKYWYDENKKAVKMWSDDVKLYDIGPDTGKVFLPYAESYFQRGIVTPNVLDDVIIGDSRWVI